jgi:putative nucleotidyltransferase with HDIG domain
VVESSNDISRLPLQHDVALRVIALLDDSDASLTELSRLIASDVALATRVLKLANSSFFGRRCDVTAIDKAIIAVGFATIRTFAVAAAFDLFAEQRAPLPRDFWSHALGTAAGSTVLARHARTNTSDAFSAGLIHDVGVALLFRRDAQAYQLHIVDANLDEAAALAVEDVVFSTNHVTIAADALSEVKFPEVLVEAVATHHDPIKRRRFSRPTLGSLVAAGQLLGDHALHQDVTQPTAEIIEVLEILGIDIHPQVILADIKDTIEEIQVFAV